MSTKPGRYFGGNNTRASVVQNPAAYAHDQKSGLFGVREFRGFGYAPEAVRDAAAERQMNGGWSKKRNPVCETCWVQKPSTGICTNCVPV